MTGATYLDSMINKAFPKGARLIIDDPLQQTNLRETFALHEEEAEEDVFDDVDDMI